MPGAHVAFISHAHFYTDQDKKLTRLIERLSAEFHAQTCHEFTVFQDRDATAWRTSWKQRIDEKGIDDPNAVALLLVIITPSLFSDPVCHDQVKWFLQREGARGQQDLIWPVYYVSAREMDDRALRKSDDVVRALASRRHSDWRELRFEPSTSAIAGKEISLLVARMHDAFWPPPVPGPADKIRSWLASHRGIVSGILGFFAAVGILAVMAFIAWLTPSHSGSTVPTNVNNPDATVFISTLILIYTVFIAVYGAVIPLILARANRDVWKWLILTLIAIAFVEDLRRIQNSLGDLYATTLKQLTIGKVQDANSEFIHIYFYGNVVVIVIALLVVCAAPKSRRED